VTVTVRLGLELSLAWGLWLQIPVWLGLGFHFSACSILSGMLTALRAAAHSRYLYYRYFIGLLQLCVLLLQRRFTCVDCTVGNQLRVLTVDCQLEMRAYKLWTLPLQDTLPTVWLFCLLDTLPTGHFGVKTLRTQGISALVPNCRNQCWTVRTLRHQGRHFGTRQHWTKPWQGGRLRLHNNVNEAYYRYNINA